MILAKEDVEMTENGHKAKDSVTQFVSSAKQMATEVSAEIARTAGRILEEAKTVKRQLVVSVRLDDESVRRIGQLVETGICSSRSEAVAFLAKSGIEARKELFTMIEERVQEIQKIKEEIRKAAL
jgi:Arc/MetJ-type ribon-helix-helix transcriptional regulator